MGDGSGHARGRLDAAFAELWCAIPKVVFSRTLDTVQGNARLAAAIEFGLVDELHMFRNPIVVGGGTPFLPPVAEDTRVELVETRTFGSRVIYDRHWRTREVAQ